MLRAIRLHKDEPIFADFLEKHGSEMEIMLFTKFNVGNALAVQYDEGAEYGIEQGECLKTIRQRSGRFS